MLVFDSSQLSAFAQASFVERMAQLLASLSGEPFGPAERDAMASQIADALARARARGFNDERDCACWVLAAWCLGPDFDSKIPSIAELLARRDVGAAYKSLALELMVRSFFVALAGHSRSAL